MRKLYWQKHPFPLLLYLEWILLSIALVAALSPLLHRPHSEVGFIFLAFTSIAALGGMGLRLPVASPVWQIVYTGLGFSLSWLPVLLIGRGERIFPPLLLIVVLRACLMFPWSGRLLVAGFAYSSFLLMLLMSFMRIRPLGIPLGRPLPRRIPEELLQGVLLHSILNSALLFGLVLLFVLLLVGAVLGEHQSRQELANANSRLRQYAMVIENQATLQERNRIAREIHDSLGHSLTAQSIQLENVAMLLETEPLGAGEHLQKARQLGKEALQNVRQSVATLRKSPLQGKSLPVAIDKLIKEFQNTSSIEFQTNINVFRSLSADVATALYRVIQEALTNIAKHSQASVVRLELREKVDTIAISVEDNGIGFEPTANTTGFGLQGMEERVEALGGKFLLSSAPSEGCTIKIQIPLVN